MSAHYILDGHTPMVAELMEWARWYEKADRRVAFTPLGTVTVSTVFLGLDHNFGPQSDGPLVFETMIFGGPHDQHCDRYSTWEEAEAGHHRAVELAREAK